MGGGKLVARRMKWISLMVLILANLKCFVNGQACEDKIESCAGLDRSYYCTGQYYVWGYENCRLHCGLCDAQPPSVLTTKPSYIHSERNADCAPDAAVCSYKGRTYMQGETWQDRCQYSCSCVDASIGYYRCKDLCPKYTNLPPGCHLQKLSGECCSQPSCNIASVSTIKPLVIVGGTSFCLYNGQYYAQDETWNDGCSQSCTCTDASRGLYSCRAVCLNWDLLPSICYLEDVPPGLCCQQPHCPCSVQIQIPSAYKDEYPGYSYV